MSNTGGPAFPTGTGGNTPYSNGMTLRDYFAAKAMQILMAEVDGDKDDNPGVFRWEPCDVAELAYEQADAMLKAREGK